MSKAHGGSPLDREISLRGLIGFVAGLVLLMVVAGALMWFMAVGLRQAEMAKDPPPPLLPEARRPAEPPAPRLQRDPAAEMAALRAEEERLLGGWGWTDEANGLARVPIERAIELLVEQRRAAAAAEESP